MEYIKPSGLARYGTFITCGVLLFIAVGTWFIHYPEIVSTQAKLTGTVSPKPLVSRISAKIMKLPLKNGDMVHKGDHIVVLESTADLNQIMALSRILDDLFTCLDKRNISAVQQLMSRQLYGLGELQPAYQALIQAYIPYRDYVSGSYIQRKKALLHNDLNMIRQSASVLKEQENLSQRDRNISRINLDNNKKLLEEKLISEEEYQKLISQDISKKMSIPQSKSGYINNKSQSNNIQKELLDLENQVFVQQELFRQAVYNLKSQLEEWKKNFLITASEDGILNFTGFYQESQYIEASKVIAYIIPPNNAIYAEMRIPQNNFGKVEQGQKVILKFNAYPWQEFGTVTGNVEYISSIPVDSGYYLAKVTLPNRLVSNYKKNLSFKEGLSANAEIITKDVRLTERLYYDFEKQIRK